MLRARDRIETSIKERNAMQYIKLGGFDYQDNPNDQTICFGQDENSVFIHQIIEDIEMEGLLKDAVEATNEATREYAEEAGFEIEFGVPRSITIDANEYLIYPQSMLFPDGRRAVQQNIYFFDPQDSVFRIVQFGTVPLSPELWSVQGDALTHYLASAAVQLLNNMALPEDMPKAPVRRFVPVS